MTSSAQRAANKANAQRSTGPTSAEGKAKASLNALAHGAYADVGVLASAALGEEPDKIVALVSSIVIELEPSCILEEVQARALARRIVGRLRVDRLVAPLIDDCEANEREALAPGTAAYTLHWTSYVLDALEANEVTAPHIDFEAVTRLAKAMLAPTTELARFIFHEGQAREPNTQQEWQERLRLLVTQKFGSVDAATTQLYAFVEQSYGEFYDEVRHRIGREAQAVLEHYRRITDLQDRTDRAIARALKDYTDLKKQMKPSRSKQPTSTSAHAQLWAHQAVLADPTDTDPAPSSESATNSPKADADTPQRTKARNEPNPT